MINNTITFKDKHIDSFCLFSKDKNPLHLDVEYASLTPFSERVLYGIAGVFFLLSKIDLRYVNISSLNIDFKKPLFINKEYFFNIDQNKKEINLKLFKGITVYTKVKINITDEVDKIPSKFSLVSLDDKTFVSKNIKWNKLPNKKNLSKLLSSFPGLENCHFWLLQVLAWSSYWAGMIYPGRQALYSQFKLDIKHNKLKFSHEENKFHEVLKQNKSTFITAEGSKISIVSFLRPEAVSHLKSSIFETSSKTLLKNLTCFVTGGTRGVGSVFSQIFCSKGATVFSSYKKNTKSAEQIEKFITSKGKPFKAFKINQLPHLDKIILKKKIDCLILNAAPSIKQIDPSEISPKDFEIEKNYFFNLTIGDIEFFKNFLAENATIINVSTTYIDEKPKGFAHYYFAKKAIENYLIDFSKKNPKLTLLNFRLPKMHTDQTNVNNLDDLIISPIEIIEKVTNHYLSFKGKKDFHTFNII